jgi:molybdopterin molybdotransferase
MLTVAEGQTIVLEHARPLPPVATPLGPSALNLVLAEDIASDLDLPPFDKALMDGYAVRAADLATGAATLTVIEEISAGKMPTLTVGAGQATRLMTGAPVPAGADAVVIVEHTRMLDGQRVRIEQARPQAGQIILPRGREMRQGEVVLRAGARLRPQEVGLLTSVGRTSVKVHPAPTVAILSTGDELVEAQQMPGPGQIRNGNSPMLLAQTVRAGGVPRMLGIARDQPQHLRALIQEGLRDDVLVLSGGVSAGKLDLVPGVLAELGTVAHFHKVAMKPGKPILFGTRARPEGGQTLVFGLPGNPVSSLVCFELFVRPAIARLKGLREPGTRQVSAILEEDFSHRSDRPTYHPGVARLTDEGFRVRAIPWFGSQDLRGLTQASAFLILPVGEHQFRAGQGLPVLLVE